MVSALGGEEQLVLEDARNPEVLPDGTIVVLRRQQELDRFWPKTGRVEPLGVELVHASKPNFRASADGTELVFFGRPLPSPKPEPPFQYYAMDLASKRVRLIAPEIKFSQGSLTIGPGGESFFLSRLGGDLLKIVEVPMHGRSSGRQVLDWSAATDLMMDTGPDGSIYLDDYDRPKDVLRLPVSGGVPDRLAGSRALNDTVQALQAPDGRVLFPTRLSGRSRLLAARPGKDPHAFVQTDDDTNSPIALLGSSTLAIQMGKTGDPDTWMVAIVSLSDGRIVRRLESTKGLEITSMAASTDGKTIYYTAAASVWAVSAAGESGGALRLDGAGESGGGLRLDGAGGAPRRLAAGDGVSVDPNGLDLIVEHNELDGAHLFRVHLAGGSEQAIPFPKALSIVGGASGSSVNKDGRILVDVDSRDSCWERPAILDPRTGKVERVKVPYAGDLWEPVWTPDGRILAQGVQSRSALWRFRKEKK
jgi:hypothetical protein